MKKSKNNIFPQRLLELRHAASLTQNQLAEKISVSRSCLANYERGERFPDNSILLIIASYFNVSKEYLLGDDEPLPPDDDPKNKRLPRFKKRKTKNGKLDLSEISATSKIALVEFCNFLEDREARRVNREAI